ncbi:MAG: regulatory protein RecX [Bacillota bacterium]
MKAVITEIRELRNGVRVTVNDQITLCLTRRDWETLSLREGDAVDVKALRHDLLLSQYPAALGRAVRLLSVRARSCFEIEKRLTDACYLEDTVEMVLTKLQSEGLLDDEAFARQWARERSARQIGRARILHELRQKGVGGELAEKALAELDPAQQNGGAAKLAAKLLKRYQNLPANEARKKTVMAMQRRGYAYGECLTALDFEMTEEEEGFYN